jgi:hypothetical protein
MGFPLRAMVPMSRGDGNHQNGEHLKKSTAHPDAIGIALVLALTGTCLRDEHRGVARREHALEAIEEHGLIWVDDPPSPRDLYEFCLVDLP